MAGGNRHQPDTGTRAGTDRPVSGGIERAGTGGTFANCGEKDCENRTGVVSIQTLAKELSQAAFELDTVYGIQTRVGLHCAPAAHRTLGTYPTGTIRFSFGWWNTQSQVEKTLDALKEICHGN